MVVKLVIVQGSTAIKEVTLRRLRTVAGRKKGCKLRINSELVSRIHCSFICDGERLTVKDLGSSNGTFVNGVRIAEAALRAGDVVQIGPVKFVVKMLENAAMSSKPRPAETPRAPVASDDVVFFESDDPANNDPEQVVEADLLDELGDEVEFVTEGQGQRVVRDDENIFVTDDEPIEADQFVIPDDDREGGDYRIADSKEKTPKRPS